MNGEYLRVFVCGHKYVYHNKIFFFMQSPSPATALTYSKDKRLFAVGHQNGWVQLWEGT